jgi:hypothetical protein
MMQALQVVEFFHNPTKISQMKRIKEYIKMPRAVKSLPLISLVFPFEVKMNQQLSLTKMLTLSADDEEKKLGTEYPKEMVAPVIKKLRHLIAGILCRKGNMSMYLLVSAASENVYYFSPTKQLSNYFPDSVD